MRLVSLKGEALAGHSSHDSIHLENCLWRGSFLEKRCQSLYVHSYTHKTCIWHASIPLPLWRVGGGERVPLSCFDFIGAGRRIYQWQFNYKLQFKPLGFLNRAFLRPKAGVLWPRPKLSLCWLSLFQKISWEFSFLEIKTFNVGTFYNKLMN